MNFRDLWQRTSRDPGHQAPGRVSGKAFAALALALSSLVFCLWIFTAVPAIALAAMARQEMKENPRMKGDFVARIAIAVGIAGCIVPLFFFGIVYLIVNAARQEHYDVAMDGRGFRISMVEERGLEKVAAEFDSLEAALEMYRVDYNAYPPAVDEHGNSIPGAGFLSSRLTTPIEYVEVMPGDPFRSVPRGAGEVLSRYRYATDGRNCWIVLSNGPDGDEDIPAGAFTSGDRPCRLDGFLRHRYGPYPVYDPTNGAESSGDILRAGGAR